MPPTLPSTRLRPASLLLVGLLVAVAACSSGGRVADDDPPPSGSVGPVPTTSGPSTTTSTTTIPPTTTGAAGPEATVRPGAPTTTPARPSVSSVAPGYGLMTREGVPARDGPDFVDAAVIRLDWSDLETAPGVFDGAGWATVERALADPRELRLRLRVMAGRYAPSWVKGPGVSADGVDCSQGGIAVVSGFQPNQTGCVPRFWEPAFLDHYDALMAEVGARYGEEARVGAVVVSACMTLFAEPFYRAQSHLASNQRLLAAGLTFERDEACQRRALEVHAERLPTTRLALAVNAWDLLVVPEDDDDGRLDGRLISWAPTYDLAQWARSRFGDRLELQNNGLGARNRCPPGEGPATNMYCFLAADPGPKGFQTQTWGNLGGDPANLERALDNALTMGACYIELPGGYRGSPDRLAALDRAAEANCGP